MNPIIKVIKGYSYPINGTGKMKPVKSWSYMCPDCEKPIYFSGEGRTRKQAKDAYHRHRKGKHAGPGLGV